MLYDFCYLLLKHHLLFSIGKKPLEAKTGSAPAFSFGAKSNARLESIGPGPGQYNVTGLSAKGNVYLIISTKFIKIIPIQ